MTRHRYACLLRPPGPGTAPRDGLINSSCQIGIAMTGHFTWGWVEYNRRLTEQEERIYDLMYLHSCMDEAKFKYVVFYDDRTKKMLLKYSLNGTFSGEAAETKELLAYEKGIPVEHIKTRFE